MSGNDGPVTIPGVLMEVAGYGILVTGESGTGKSRLALGLLDRGHALVADDAVELERRGDRLYGRCPRELAGLLEVRGVGIIDVRRLFGNDSLRRETRVGLVVHLAGGEPVLPRHARPGPAGLRDGVRLAAVSLHRLTLPARPEHPLPLLVETAARLHALDAREERQ